MSKQVALFMLFLSFFIYLGLDQNGTERNGTELDYELN